MNYPRPPGLLTRLVGLSLRPESWAQAARYPTRATIIPLILAILLSGLAVAVGESTRILDNLRHFAATYDGAQFPALELNDAGVLRTLGPLSDPIQFDPGLQRFFVDRVLIDPTGKTDPTTIKTHLTLLVTDTEFVLSDAGTVLWHNKFPIAELPPTGKTYLINGTTMNRRLAEEGSAMGIAVGISAFLIHILGDSLWSLLVLFLISPLIVLAAAGAPKRPEGGGPSKRLLLPRRAAYRMAAGILVPLTLLGGALTAWGHPVSSALGESGSHFFWFLAAFAMAIWTGFTAHKMYGPTPTQRRGS